MSSAAKAAKAALVADLAVVFPTPTQVTYGHPGTHMADDIISVGNIDATRERGPLGTQRKLTEALTVTVTISVWRGGPSSQDDATERALDMLAALEAYLTDVGVANSAQLTLAGSVWQAWVTAFELNETDATMTDADGTPLLNLGRLCEINVTVSANARI